MKKNKNYRNGRFFEYSIAQKLKNHGFYVIRSAGSHTDFDLIALKSKTLLIQCKKNIPPSKAEKNFSSLYSKLTQSLPIELFSSVEIILAFSHKKKIYACINKNKSLLNPPIPYITPLSTLLQSL